MTARIFASRKKGDIFCLKILQFTTLLTVATLFGEKIRDVARGYSIKRYVIKPWTGGHWLAVTNLFLKNLFNQFQPN